MRWNGQELGVEQSDALPGMAKLNNLVRSVQTPEFAGITFHEVLAKSALNHVPGQSAMPFEWTINPYRGCSHACVYCLGGETLILMADGRQKQLRDVREGDEICGTEVVGAYRRYVKTLVLAHWRTSKPGYRVTLADGTEIIASGDHRFLSDRGWKYVTDTEGGRPHLTTKNKLLGFGIRGLNELDVPDFTDADYRRGYLTGIIRGDGHIGSYRYERRPREDRVHRFRLALADQEALDRTRAYLSDYGLEMRQFSFSEGTESRRAMTAIRTSRGADVQRIRDLIAWRMNESKGWHAGYLAGIFDAEGSCSGGVLRISNKSEDILERICSSMEALEIAHVREAARPNGVAAVRVTGGLPMRARFFQLTEPAILRKRSIEGAAVKSDARLQVVSIQPLLGGDIDMFDITTGTGDFIANGVISHNCFARPTHRYLDLNTGEDFDRQIVVKVNVADVLRTELRKPSWQHAPVALGTNTDPYQRAEGRYTLMPGIISALAESGTPFSVLTKGSLLRRDLSLLAEAAKSVPVQIAMSIAIYDDELQHSIEPGTPSTDARLATVTAVRDAGLECSVFLMPVLPYLTDSVEHLDDALARIAAAGGTSAMHTALHLKPGVKEWFMTWLAREHPELVPRYRELYKGATYAPAGYRKWLAERIRPLVRKHGLDRRREGAWRAPKASAAPGGTSRALEPPTLF